MTTNVPATIPKTRSPRRSRNAMAKYSVTPTSAALPTSHTKSDQGFHTINHTSNGIATTPVASLVRSTQVLALRLLLPGAAEATLAALVLTDRLQELALAKVRPQGRGNVDLGVGDL